MTTAATNFFRTLNLDPSKRRTGGQINEAFERGVWMAKGHDGSPVDGASEERGVVEIEESTDRADFSFSYNDGRGVAGPTLSVTETTKPEDGERAKTVSLAMNATQDGTRMRVDRFESFEGDTISDMKHETYLLDRQTGTLFMEQPTA